MQNNNYSSITDLPNSCRAQADSMENAVRAEDFRVAELSGSSFGEIQELEDKIGKNLGKKISLVAYEDSSH